MTIMKKYQFFQNTLTGFATIVILLSLSMNFSACQVDDLNADEEIAQATYTRVKEVRLEREYAEAFAEEFGTPDAEHDWSYKPLTIISTEGEGGAQLHTRAGGVPSISYKSNDPLKVPYSTVKELINAIPEGGNNYERMNTNIMQRRKLLMIFIL